MVSMPRQTTSMFSSQKAKKQIQTATTCCLPTMARACGAWNRQLVRRSKFECRTSRRRQSRAESGNVRATHSKRCAHEDWERNAVLCPGMRVQNHRNQNDQVAEKNGADRLLPTHSARNKARSQHVGGNTNAHRDPKRRVIVDAPGAPIGRNGRQILVVKARIESIFHGQAYRLAYLKGSLPVPIRHTTHWLKRFRRCAPMRRWSKPTAACFATTHRARMPVRRISIFLDLSEKSRRRT